MKRPSCNVAVTCLRAFYEFAACSLAMGSQIRATSGFRKVCVRAMYRPLWIVWAWKHPYDQSCGHRMGLRGCHRDLLIAVRSVMRGLPGPGECKYGLYSIYQVKSELHPYGPCTGHAILPTGLLRSSTVTIW